MTLTISATNDLASCHALRHEVFVEEQGVSVADERDTLDAEAHHLLATLDGVPIGTARLLIMGDTGKIGRVCVRRSARGKGIGKELILASLAHLREIPGVTRAKLGAQTHALGFYEALGFAAFGPEYDDAGLPHRDMERPL